MKVVKALKRSNNGVIHAAVDMLCALMCVSTLRLAAGSSHKSIVVHFLDCSHGHLFIQWTFVSSSCALTSVQFLSANRWQAG